MAIKLPRFEGTPCVCLTACGLVQPGPKALLHELRKAKPMVARYGSGPRTMYLRLLRPGKGSRHLHIDCALRKFFPTGAEPKVTHKKSQIMRSVETVLGKRMDVGVIGTFMFPIADLPETGLIRSLYTERESAGIRIKVTAAKFSISGGPVSSIGWQAETGGRKLLVQVKGQKTVTVQETYLLELLDWIKGQARILLLGRDPHGLR